LGVSKMYQYALNKIPGLEHIISTENTYNRAENFAGRLFTLPTHDRITDKDLQLLDKSLHSFQGTPQDYL